MLAVVRQPSPPNGKAIHNSFSRVTPFRVTREKEGEDKESHPQIHADKYL